MTDKIVTAARFRALLEAYGADAQHWPAEEHASALAFVDAHGEAQSWLAEARALDDWLDTAAVADLSHAAADEALFEEIVAQYAARPAMANVVPFARVHVSKPAMWMAGLGAAACLAGAILGVNLGQIGADDARVQIVLEQTQLADAGN